VTIARSEMEIAACAGGRKHLVQQHRDNGDQRDRAEYQRNDNKRWVHFGPVRQ
jgi:hypothetical protein